MPDGSKRSRHVLGFFYPYRRVVEVKLVIGSIFIGFAAYYLARGVGIPHWREGFSWAVVGDASDIGFAAGMGVFLIAQWIRPS